MAWSASAVFAYATLDAMNKNVDLATDSMKVALYENTGTPNQDVTTAALTYYNGSGSEWVTANETTNTAGSAYVAGGVALGSLSLTQTSNVVEFTSTAATGPQWTSASITAYGCLVYDTTATIGICYNYFNGQQTVAAGTFTVSWNASGIATWTH